LPSGTVEELFLYAPFHDPGAAAIHGLVERLTPRRVTLAVQSGCRTIIEPAAIGRVIDLLGVPLTVVEDIDKRYRHGKLVEAMAADGGRWALTGSANLSAAALLHAVGDGGNVEVGLVSTLPSSLFPTGQLVTLADVPAVSIRNSGADRAGGGVILLAATRTDAGLLVNFARPTHLPVRILASSYASFDTWSHLGVVPEGAADYLFPDIDLPGGSRVQATWDGPEGTVHGALVFVIDPDRVLERVGDSPARRPVVRDPIALITDPRLVDMWLSGLGQLATARNAIALPRGSGSGAPRSETDDTAQHGGGLRIDTDAEDWLRYADDAKARLGSAMFHFALGGFPALRAFTAAPGTDLAEPTDRIIDERKAGLEGDDANSVNDDVDPVTADTATADVSAADQIPDEDPPNDPSVGTSAGSPSDLQDLADVSQRTEYEKRRIRAALTRAVTEDADDLPAIDRLAIVTLVLCAAQSGVWDTAQGKDGWLHVLADATAKLDLGDVSERIQPQTASLAAVAVYLMRDQLFRLGRTSELLRYEDACAETAHLYADADPAIVADYAAPFTNSRGFPVDPDDVMRVITMIVQDDPLVDAIDALDTRHPTWQVHKHGRNVLHVHGDFRIPFTAAAEALDALTGVDPTAVWATNDDGRWTLVARQEDDLIHVETQKANVTWRHYRLSNLISPTGIARDGNVASRARVKHVPLVQPFPEAVAVLAAVGVDVTDGPPAACF
jgi:hypothetical protein